MTSVVLEANNINALNPVIDFARNCGVMVKFTKTNNKKMEYEAFKTEEEASDFCNSIAMEWLDEAW